MAAGGKKNPAENFGELLKEFGDAVSKIFDDPELKEKAKDFGDSAMESARHFGGRFKDEEVKEKFKDVGEAAKQFGNSVSDYFKEESEKDKSKKKDDIAKDTPPEEKAEKKMDWQPCDSRPGRIAGYGFSIFFTTLFLVFLKYFNQYIALYRNAGGTWERYPFLTGDFEKWLPIVSTALIAAIVGYIILIIYDGYLFRQVAQIVIDLFGLSAMVALLIIFPFDFTVMPGNDLSAILEPVATVVIIMICVGTGIGILVRFVKLVTWTVKR